MAIEVNHWGLHREGDLVFLHEQENSRCVTPGLERLQSPFVVRQKMRCPHRFLQGEAAPKTASPPKGSLAWITAPVTDGGVYWLPPEAIPALDDSVELPWIWVAWAKPLNLLVPELNLTNLAPLVIRGYEPKHLEILSKVLGLPRIRTIILCGYIKPPGVVLATHWEKASPPGSRMDLLYQA